MIVMKFGGTSVGNATAIAQVVENVRRFRSSSLPRSPAQDGGRLLIVTSAMGGVTDDLLRAAKCAAIRDGQTFRQVGAELRDSHHRVAEELVADSSRRATLLWEIDALLNDFENLCQAVYVLGEVTPRGLDAIASTGERLAARVLAAALNESGIPSQVVEATHLVITDDTFGNAYPQMEETRQASRGMLLPILEEGSIPVVTGFIGATREGTITTLGRGGSDYSAAILGSALDADEIWIWTEVYSLLTQGLCRKPVRCPASHMARRPSYPISVPRFCIRKQSCLRSNALSRSAS
jgi:aspartokinase/homoserine dehydrogenase 1